MVNRSAHRSRATAARRARRVNEATGIAGGTSITFAGVARAALLETIPLMHQEAMLEHDLGRLHPGITESNPTIGEPNVKENLPGLLVTWRGPVAGQSIPVPSGYRRTPADPLMKLVRGVKRLNHTASRVVEPMCRAGFEPATLGLRGDRWDLGRSRSSWKTSAFERITATRSRWISVGLVAPLLPQQC